MFAGVILRGDTFAARIDTALADRQPLPRPDLRQYQQALGRWRCLVPATFRYLFHRRRRTAGAGGWLSGGGEGPSIWPPPS